MGGDEPWGRDWTIPNPDRGAHEGKVTGAKSGSPFFQRKISAQGGRLLNVGLTKLVLITTGFAWIYPTRALGTVTFS